MNNRSTLSTKRLNPSPAVYSSGDGTNLSLAPGRRSENQAPKLILRSANRGNGKFARHERLSRIEMEQLMNEIQEVEADVIRLQEEEQENLKELEDFASQVNTDEDEDKAIAIAEFVAAVRADNFAAAAAAASIIVKDKEEVERIMLEYDRAFGEDVTCMVYVDDAGYDADIEEGDGSDDDGDEEEKTVEKEENHYGIIMCVSF